MSEEHGALIKTPKQLVTVVVLAFVVPVALILMIASLVIGSYKSPGSPEEILQRIKPVAQVKIAAPAGPKGALTGEQVYKQVCSACHATGVANAPKFADKEAWAKLTLAQGQPTVVQHALNGIRAMPARGGNPDLTDAEVERAVVFLANQAGAGWKEPPAGAAVAAAAPAPGAAPAAAPHPRRRERATRSSHRRAASATSRPAPARRRSATATPGPSA